MMAFGYVLSFSFSPSQSHQQIYQETAYSWTCMASAIVLDHYASSPTSSSLSRKCSSLPFGGDLKEKFSQMLVAMGIRVRKRAIR